MEMMEQPRRPATANLGTGRGSHVISKCRPATSPKISSPAIRIIHIYAPEIIKTDAANFRELVQKLTGKPTGKITSKKERRSKTMSFTRSNVGAPRPEESPEFRPFFGNPGQVKEEDVDGSFFCGLGEFDSFMEDIGGFPLLPFSSSSHMDVFGEI